MGLLTVCRCGCALTAERKIDLRIYIRPVTSKEPDVCGVPIPQIVAWTGGQ
jgi:hypothetical protein